MDVPSSDISPAGNRARAGMRRVLIDQRGATAVEYGFILAVIVLAMLGALSDVGNVTTSMWNNINAKVTNAH